MGAWRPALARAAVEKGEVDLVALGRPLISDPEWVEKARSGAPVRRCLSCDHCVSSMRSGANISCVVNPVAGSELDFTDPRPPEGERICVVGSGPAGLSYASLVADRNCVTVIERAPAPGGAFRFTGKAPLFGEVEAVRKFVRGLRSGARTSVREKDVEFRYDLDAAENPRSLHPTIMSCSPPVRATGTG